MIKLPKIREVSVIREMQQYKLCFLTSRRILIHIVDLQLSSSFAWRNEATSLKQTIEASELLKSINKNGATNGLCLIQPDKPFKIPRE